METLIASSEFAASSEFTASSEFGSEHTVEQVGEFDVIARSLVGRIQPVTTELGPGDDAAIVTSGDGRVVVSSDMLVEGRHFRMDWSSPRDIGRKAVAQNAADVVSMGARPTAFTVSLGCPPSTPVDVIDAISAGIWDAATDLGAGVVGGDLVQSPVVVVSVTVLGDLGGRPAVLRSGAKIGDKIAVAGLFGCSAAGLALLLDEAESFPDLLAAHRVPNPPYQSAWDAAESAHSMTDVSDGLIADLRHLAEASHVRFDIVSAAVPTSLDVASAAEALDVDPLDWILSGGEDHGFAATFGPEVEIPSGWTVIGEVAAGSGVSVDGSLRESGGGWHSFSTTGTTAV
ncbi:MULTISPECIES: thiamine-phosphate kinase [Rhodococcus]|uniref:thiamine-phosphate kinase n=1 Tax=Rhodococcus TaxID=1827 RepID=UPI00242C6C42|nr:MULTISPECIES: thiamine-phosphate kinase [Rhodococcus]MDJ0405997.1 thiamine-phosphate kinase [Rhodococcus erythropolis]MDN3457640.1 thiamine-phosphate kinase [Rhodococcus sp. APC 3903]